jgi:acyl-CoA reductase-like NAD-dependent aldehyde dehydrogenase
MGVREGFAAKVYPNPADPEVAEQIAKGRALFEEQYLGKTFEWSVGRRDLFVKQDSYATFDPNQPETMVGRFPKFSKNALEQIVAEEAPIIHAAGRNFFLTVPWQERVKLLRTISAVTRERFWLLCAAKMYETGQSLAEAIGETDEEVDFPLANALYLEEHHQELLAATPKFSGDVSGKRYVPHGVFLNVSPFNFPGAIPMDMATKALAMGNAFIEKSSPKSSLCGFLMGDSIAIAFSRMGIDARGVVNYASGDARVVDAFLSSPHIAGMSFTGSSKVLSAIKKKHGDLLRYGWAGRAKLVTGSAETSGVNTFIVCADADPVYAAHEYVKSFVGRSGQKCSSARIGFVHEAVYEQFVVAMIIKLDELHYGDVKEGAYLGAMISGRDRDKLATQIDTLKSHKVVETLYEKEIVNGGGERDFPPTVLLGEDNLNEDAKRTLMNTEFFGPVSTIVRFRDLDEVELLCDFTDFALTGTVFTKNPEVLRRVLSFIPAGNVYWNRKCTGALVETECFGGLRSASSPLGVKGKGAMLLFGSQVTFSGFYPVNATEAEREVFTKMFNEEGLVLSKS